VRALATYREQRKHLEVLEETVETAIKSRMGECAVLTGQGFKVTWKRTKDVEQTDWKSIADGLLRQLPDEQRQGLLGMHTSVRPGFRPFRLVESKETKE